MPSLQVRELPENIYTMLQNKAQRDHRSLAQEAVIALAKGLQTSLANKDRRQELLREIAASSYAGTVDTTLDPVGLLREDRDR